MLVYSFKRNHGIIIDFYESNIQIPENSPWLPVLSSWRGVRSVRWPQQVVALRLSLPVGHPAVLTWLGSCEQSLGCWGEAVGTQLHETQAPASPSQASLPTGQRVGRSVMISDWHFIICILTFGVE